VYINRERAYCHCLQPANFKLKTLNRRLFVDDDGFELLDDIVVLLLPCLKTLPGLLNSVRLLHRLVHCLLQLRLLLLFTQPLTTSNKKSQDSVLSSGSIFINININIGTCIAHSYNQTKGALHDNTDYSELYV